MSRRSGRSYGLEHQSPHLPEDDRAGCAAAYSYGDHDPLRDMRVQRDEYSSQLREAQQQIDGMMSAINQYSAQLQLVQAKLDCIRTLIVARGGGTTNEEILAIIENETEKGK